MNRPPATSGLRHLALFISSQNFLATVQFYTDLLGMEVEWQPDDANIYLTSGNDNLALHRRAYAAAPREQQRLDHFGFIIDKIAEVDCWHAFLVAHKVPIRVALKTHRDGARSFYCADPDGNYIQIVYHPPLSRKN